MRPWLETVVIPSDRSWLLFDRRLPEFPFNWHYHPEFELTLTIDSVGMRFVGDNVESYSDGDLVLLGPNLPHAWQSHSTSGDAHRALVCWFTEAWITSLVDLSPELGIVRGLLEEARRGVVFGAATSAAVRGRLLSFADATPTQLWFGLIELLVELCRDKTRLPLASSAINPVGGSRDRIRLGRVLDWLNEHYTEPVELERLAKIAHLSTSQLQRLFKRSTRLSVSGYVAQRRIGHACALLAQEAIPVSRVGEMVGYHEPAYFARQFKAAKGCSPTEYRRLFAETLGAA